MKNDKPVFEIFSRAKNHVGEPYNSIKIYADGKVEGIPVSFAIVNRIPALLQQKLERVLYTPPQTDLYEEAKAEALFLVQDGWITKYECRDILISLYSKRYLTGLRPVLVNPKPHRFYDGE
jgi:hypothetical protein